MVECTSTEKLIEAVKEHPMLYDLTHENYRNKVANSKKWMEIGELLDIHGEIAKKKWKGLRDSYTKHLRAIRSTGRITSLLNRYRSWPWAEHMSFLMPSLEAAQADSNQSQNDVEDTGEQVVSSPPAAMDSSIFSPIIETTFSVNKQKNKPKKRKVISGNCYTRSNTDRAPEIDDDIDLMFKSFAKTVKSFSPKRKIIFKAKLAKLIAEEELANLNELPVKCSTCSVSVNDHWTINNPGTSFSEHNVLERNVINPHEEKAIHFLCND